MSDLRSNKIYLFHQVRSPYSVQRIRVPLFLSFIFICIYLKDNGLSKSRAFRPGSVTLTRAVPF